MSTNLAKVSRTLVVKSPYHLWQLLKDKDENWCNESKIIVFMYAFEKILNGCRCDREDNIKNLKNEYIKFKESDDSKNVIMTIYNCQSIIFEENDELLHQQLDSI